MTGVVATDPSNIALLYHSRNIRRLRLARATRTPRIRQDVGRRRDRDRHATSGPVYADIQLYIMENALTSRCRRSSGNFLAATSRTIADGRRGIIRCTTRTSRGARRSRPSDSMGPAGPISSERLIGYIRVPPPRSPPSRSSSGSRSWCFSWLYLLPGDPVQAIAGEVPLERERGSVARAVRPNDSALGAVRAVCDAALQGDLGPPLPTRRRCSTEILTFLPATLTLTLTAMVVAVVPGVSLGTIAAPAPHLSTAAHVLALAGVSIPAFWLGLMLLLVFSVWLNSSRPPAPRGSTA